MVAWMEKRYLMLHLRCAPVHELENVLGGFMFEPMAHNQIHLTPPIGAAFGILECKWINLLKNVVNYTTDGGQVDGT